MTRRQIETLEPTSGFTQKMAEFCDDQIDYQFFERRPFIENNLLYRMDYYYYYYYYYYYSETCIRRNLNKAEICSM
jgi:hypothetical protein